MPAARAAGDVLAQRGAVAAIAPRTPLRLIEHFRALEARTRDEIVMWEIRQVVFRKRLV